MAGEGLRASEIIEQGRLYLYARGRAREGEGEDWHKREGRSEGDEGHSRE